MMSALGRSAAVKPRSVKYSLIFPIPDLRSPPPPTKAQGAANSREVMSPILAVGGGCGDLQQRWLSEAPF